MSTFLKTRISLAIGLILITSIGVAEAEAAYGDITLVGHTVLPQSDFITDVWGWIDPVTKKEYAVVGEGWGAQFHIIDISNPASPNVITTVVGSGFDVKVYENYLYACDGYGPDVLDSKIYDISTPASPVLLPTRFKSAHNITISNDGYMYTEYPGWTVFDLNPNPETPVQLFTAFSDGHDGTVHGDRVYSFTGYQDTVKIWDVTNHASPVVIGNVTDPDIGYTHSGDVDKTENYLYVTDEFAADPDTVNLDADIIIFDISNLASPTRVGDIKVANTTVHNLYVIGNFMFVSYYTDGFHVYDVSNPATPVLLDRYDTTALSGEGYDGAFGVYPFSPTGHILVSDAWDGFFIFSVEGYNGPLTAAGEASLARRDGLNQNYPNPFNPSTTIEYELSQPGPVGLHVFDVGGQLVRTLVDGTRNAGLHQAAWDGTDDSGQRVASGVYFYRLDTEAYSSTKRMTLLK